MKKRSKESRYSKRILENLMEAKEAEELGSDHWYKVLKSLDKLLLYLSGYIRAENPLETTQSYEGIHVSLNSLTYNILTFYCTYLGDIWAENPVETAQNYEGIHVSLNCFLGV